MIDARRVHFSAAGKPVAVAGFNQAFLNKT